MNSEELRTWLRNPPWRPLIMGVLNVTPDSFSDGGRYSDVEAAAAHAEAMAAAGAQIIDIGGESTRPGSQRIDPAEQLRRVMPVIGRLAGRVNAVLSIDTTRSAVARAAVDAGVGLINDISGGEDDPQMLATAAGLAVPIILMHMQGQPANMQANPTYDDVVREVGRYLAGRVQAALAAGIDRRSILIDPGIGFGKTAEHNLQLLNRLPELAALGRPVVVGASRKGFIGRITGENDPASRLYGTAATVAWAAANGAAVLRVHDVGPMSQVLRVIEAIRDASP